MHSSEIKTNIGFVKLLCNPNFLALWVAQVLSQLADKVVFILAIAIAISPDYPDASVPLNSRESAIMIAFTLPAVFFGSIAGIYVDRHAKRRVMIVCNLLRGALVLLVPFLPKSLLLLLLAAFLISTMTQAFAPAEQSAIPLLVPASGLMAANALFTMTMMAAMIVGFAVGAPLLKWSASLVPQFSYIAREILVGGMYLISGAILLRLPQNEEVHPRAVGFSLWSDLRDGLRYVRHNRPIAAAMLQMILLFSVLAALIKFSINLTAVIGLHRDEFGFLLAAAGVGLAIGAVILGQFGDRLAHLPLPLIGFIGIAFALAMFAFVNQLWLSLLLGAFLGLHGSLVIVPMQTLIQHHTPEHMRGKVFGLLNNGENIAASLPLALAAVALDLATNTWGEIRGMQVVLLSTSLFVVLLGGWAWSYARGSVGKIV